VDPSPPEAAPWWGPCEVDLERAVAWQVGPLSVRAARRASEWRVAWRWSPAQSVVGPSVAPRRLDDLPLEEMDAEHTCHRYGLAQTEPALTLRPLLADRPLISRPEVPFTVQPGTEVRLLVTTPLWLRLEAGGAALIELVCRRPSDTWFGVSTREGALCYAGRTHLRPTSEPGDVPLWHARTPIRLRNRAADPLHLARLKLPVDTLPLFVDRGIFWTPAVILDRREAGSDLAAVAVDAEPPFEADAHARRVAPPRRDAPESAALRVFNSFFR